MKKLLIIMLSLIFLTGCNDNNSNNTSSANTQRLSAPINIQNINNENNTNINNINSIEQTQNNTNFIEQPQETNQTTTSKEEEISSFTTKILTDDDKRENNIDITCSKINDYTVKSGETFSFTDTVGKATESKGYEKADIFDANGNKTKGLGGGNCQVSSTLYNAVLEASGNFEIVERHPHNQKVYYVPDGKDATVSYGSLDFKFKNNNDFDVKIYASSNDEEVNVRLVKLNY